MTCPLIVIRPEPGNAETVARARGAGLDAVAMPLQAVEAVEWDMPDGHFDALLAGSANAFRHGGNKLAALRALPVHAVGAHTAQAAMAAGFVVATTGEGRLQEVVDRLAGAAPVRLLRLGGAERTPLSEPAAASIVERVAYRLIDRDFTPTQRMQFAKPCCVALHSASAARNLRRNCKQFAVDPNCISVIALAPRIARAAGLGWARIEVSPVPDDAALLALGKALCQ